MTAFLIVHEPVITHSDSDIDAPFLTSLIQLYQCICGNSNYVKIKLLLFEWSSLQWSLNFKVWPCSITSAANELTLSKTSWHSRLTAPVIFTLKYNFCPVASVMHNLIDLLLPSGAMVTWLPVEERTNWCWQLSSDCACIWMVESA